MQRKHQNKNAINVMARDKTMQILIQIPQKVFRDRLIIFWIFICDGQNCLSPFV